MGKKGYLSTAHKRRNHYLRVTYPLLKQRSRIANGILSKQKPTIQDIMNLGDDEMKIYSEWLLWGFVPYNMGAKL